MQKSLKSTVGTLIFAAALATAPIAVDGASAAGGSVTVSMAATAWASVATSSAVGESMLGKHHPLALPAGSLMLTAVSVTAVGESTVVLLDTAFEGSRQVIKVVFKGLEASSLAIGQTIKAVSTEAGHILLSNGRFLAFAPNKTGRQLLYSEELSQ